MSEAVLRARKQNIPTMINRKVIVIPRRPSEAEIGPDYIDLVFNTKSPHKIPDSCQEQETRASVAENVAYKLDGHRWLWAVAILITATIILLGLVVGYLKPGPVTGVILPTGLTLWWLLYKVANHFDHLS